MLYMTAIIRGAAVGRARYYQGILSVREICFTKTRWPGTYPTGRRRRRSFVVDYLGQLLQDETRSEVGKTVREFLQGR